MTTPLEELIVDPLDCPDFPVVYVEGQRMPQIAGVIHLEPGESMPSAAIRMTLDRNKTSAADVLIKNLIVGGGITNTPDRHLEWQFTWDAGDLLAGLGQRMLVEIDEGGVGLFETIVQFNLNVLERPS